ncbi:MAG: hypothetical protein U0359_28705 [Byssovorax sp.]
MRACLLAAALLLAGCSTERLDPLPIASAGPDAGPPPADAGPEPEDASPPADAAVKRQVLQRNPFGHVEKAENLLWDGDFEWTSPFADQYGWLSGPPFSYTFGNVVVGAACRSGLKCVKIPKKKAIVGIGVASQGSKLAASFIAHLSMGTCDQVKSTISDFFDKAEPDVPVVPVETAPDAQGDCRYLTVLEARAHKPYFYIENKTGADIIVDDVVLEKASGSSPLSVIKAPPSAEDAAALALAAEQIQKLRGPHDAPPNAARRAFEAWKQR